MILVLAIESATPRGSVALAGEDRVLAVRPLPPGRQASETFLPAVEALLRRAGCPAGAVTHVAVSAGPGSFTGLRVGMSAAKGFAFGWSVPLVPVPTLKALAMRFPTDGIAVCPVLDARRREVYAGIYRWERGECMAVVPDAAIAPDRLPDNLPPGQVLFCGDGIGPYGALFRDRMGERALFPPPDDEFPSAGTVGLLAAALIAEGTVADLRTAIPRYLRRSEAEIKRGTAE